ncbi:MAG: hypothetical protein OXS28_06775 [Gammaproteobacteria bacterium]|nr:hypothetical protein [Gammaproteobacteria bacterium]
MSAFTYGRKCYTARMKLNLTTTWEDVRRPRIILPSAGLLAGVLEEGNIATAGGLVLASLALLWSGNLEH